MDKKVKLRDILVDVALQWQASFGIAPSITSSISEYDAAMLVCQKKNTLITCEIKLLLPKGRISFIEI